ncbi:hypothetical protein PMAYCL1PPCAC_15758 [Pristionchus mayeri]|uniref:Sorbitol dehydrogenase n=1 Tax=Pristionchus mayeri TaxID=1317129 RepID=A0AAN5CJI4_9BILA|nr:hypothetical protein PMAYCL1PPCAC_15758 [Pristionchus mayeri]
MDNLSAVLYGKADLRLEQREIPVAKKGELLIRVHTVAICGSDVHYLVKGSIGPFAVRDPMVIGHETSGTVEAVGEGVEGFAPGDRVAIESGIPCRVCFQCKSGSYNLCPDVHYFATPPVHGTITRYIAHPADFCFKLPPSISYDEGALLEPLSVGIHACNRAGVTVGQKVLVLGAGPIGILNALVALARGVSTVVITDINEERLATAKECGVHHTVNVKGLSPAEAREQVLAALGKEPDVAIDCTGLGSSIETAITTVRAGGVVTIVGIASDRCDLPMVAATVREVDVRGVLRYKNCYPTAVELVASKKIDLSKLTRAHYPLEQTVEAFERTQKGDVVKVFVRCDDSS